MKKSLGKKKGACITERLSQCGSEKTEEGAWKEEEGFEEAERDIGVKLLPWTDPWAVEKTGVIGTSQENLERNGWVKNDHHCE